MGCSSCGTDSGGGCAPAGCKSNGSCATGCNSLNVFDWFNDIELPDDFVPFDVVELRFKSGRKAYYRNKNKLDLFIGDHVLTESNIGFDIGTVSATGEIVRLQLKKKHIREDNPEMKNITRLATEAEMAKYEDLKTKENTVLERGRTVAFDLRLEMKISDIEFQGDGRKVTFYYTAESRVDFRELIRRYAEEFRVKIEMRHISYREEASRLGGIGVCGRQLCCSTWLTDYKQVNTGAARVQNLSINMEKLAGQCGKLKCCLNYELDMYVEALNEMPKMKTLKLDTLEGVAFSRKTDILKRIIWFAYEDSQTWVPLPLSIVNESIAANRSGQQVQSLTQLDPNKHVAAREAHHNEPEMQSMGDMMEDREEGEGIRTLKAGEKRREGRDGRDGRDGKKNWKNKGPRPQGTGPANTAGSGPRPDNRNNDRRRDGNKPRDGAPRDGAPRDGAPRDGAPRNQRPPRDGAPRDGAPRDGAPNTGPPKDGAPRDGAPRDGAPRNDRNRGRNNRGPRNDRGPRPPKNDGGSNNPPPSA